MNFLNPYSYIGGAAVVAAVVSGFYLIDNDRDNWRSKYQSQLAATAVLNERIRNMTETQNNQTKTSEENVTKVIQAPAQVIKIPVPKEVTVNCKTPEVPEELKGLL